jgi:hypothetical protein
VAAKRLDGEGCPVARTEESVAREEASPEARGEASDTAGGEASGVDAGGTSPGSAGEADRTQETGDAEDSQDSQDSSAAAGSEDADDGDGDGEGSEGGRERAERAEADEQEDEDGAGEGSEEGRERAERAEAGDQEDGDGAGEGSEEGRERAERAEAGDQEGEDGADDADSDADSNAEADDRDEPALPPVETVELGVLIDDYQRRDAGRRPWNWAGLPAGHRVALVELIDGFAVSYNRTWAMADDQLIPPCWHRHPALAYDLAALVWAFHGAYRGREASPEAALRFQGQLISFADRLDRWLGHSAQDCRDGHHPGNWRPVRSTAYRPDRESLEYADEVTLLGVEHFGFEASTGSAQV